MTKQIQDAYIVAATRTPVGKAPKGMFRNVRPDDMLAHVLKSVVAQAPGIDVNRIEPICTATPEYVCTYLKRLEEIGCKSAVLAWDAMRMGEDVLDAIASR